MDNRRTAYQQSQLKASSHTNQTINDTDTTHLIKSVYTQIKSPSQPAFDVTIIRNPNRLYPFSSTSIQLNHVLLEMPPKNRWPIDIELAMAAHEAVHTYHHHSVKQDLSIASCTLLTIQWLWHVGTKLAPTMTAGICMGWLLHRFLSRRHETDADMTALQLAPMTRYGMRHCLEASKNQFETPKPLFHLSIFDTHPSFDDRLNLLTQARLLSIENHSASFTQTAMLKLRHQLLMQPNMQVDSRQIIQNPYARYLCEHAEKDSLVKQVTSLCDKSYTRYILESDKKILKTFYNTMRQSESQLGKLYRTLSFDEFINRLATKKYAAAYLNGGLLMAREPRDNLGKQLGPGGVSWHPSINTPLMAKIGTENDTNQLYLSYLSLEEITLSALFIDQALVIPLGDGSRTYETINDSTSSELQFTWDAKHSLESALPQLLTMSMPAGIECREGTTSHPDLWMVAVPSNPTTDFLKHAQRYRQPAFIQAAHHLYGNKLAIHYAAETAQHDSDFIAIQSTTGEQWYLCKPAYKHRCKQIFQQQLIAADHHMRTYALGTTYQLKGIGLGAFGFSQAQDILEKLFIEALNEALAESELTYIKTICLINLPSQLAAPNNIATPHQINGITIAMRTGAPLEKNSQYGMLGGTHACGDHASQDGNEFHAGIGPASSDDPANLHHIYHPSLRGITPHETKIIAPSLNEETLTTRTQVKRR